MDIKRKIEIAEQSIKSITTHEDADSALRGAALERLEEFIAAERESMKARVSQRISDSVRAIKEA